jgi:hypothetical protein
MTEKICKKMQNKIEILEKQSKKNGIEKEIPRVLWLKEDLKLMKVACKEDECPQPRCKTMLKRHDL